MPFKMLTALETFSATFDLTDEYLFGLSCLSQLAIFDGFRIWIQVGIKGLSTGNGLEANRKMAIGDRKAQIRRDWRPSSSGPFRG